MSKVKFLHPFGISDVSMQKTATLYFCTLEKERNPDHPDRVCANENPELANEIIRDFLIYMGDIMAQILIIEDETSLRSLMKDALEKEGHEIIEASDGDMGIKMFSEHQPDVVITDILMPKKEGLETILEMTEQSPDVNIIAISGGGIGLGDDLLEISLEFGAKHALRKPVTMKHLLEVVQEVIEK